MHRTVVFLLSLAPAAQTAICTGGVDLIKSFEGFVARAEPDPIGLPTVGYGHLCEGKNDPACQKSFTEAQATQFLIQDLVKYETCVTKALGSVRPNAAQFAAMVSFTFNLGCGAFQKSTFLKKVKAGANIAQAASEEFPKFVNAGGKPFEGLIRRRNAEIALASGRGLFINRCKSNAPATPVNPPATGTDATSVPPPSHYTIVPRPNLSGASCTASVNNKDVRGVCVSTASCGAQSGTSIPWFCGSSANVQCCVQVSQAEAALFESTKPYLGSTCAAPLPGGADGSKTSGTCRYTSLCANDGQTSVPGYCPGPANIQCCVGPASKPIVTPKQPHTTKTTASVHPGSTAPRPTATADPFVNKVESLPKESHDAYSRGQLIGQIKTVPLEAKQVKDTTAVAYLKMKAAAAKAGNHLVIVSGFRTMAKQQELYRKYLAGTGNLAAKPGFSNHQNGKALDLNPEDGNNYSWLAANAAKFDFCRTVPSERWHWEYRPTDKSPCITA
ncbi:hypothetical protein HDU91_007315 [Kappamyces sp. JEL0680]|nr:hypothetical protein HDU91_007315 [Kappamyces sp. JEL0680]